MKIQILYILDCPWCLKTKKIVKQSLKELGIKAKIEEILIDTKNKAKKYKFLGSPTVRINGRDIQPTIKKDKCKPCEEISKIKGTKFIKQECSCGCRVYIYKNKLYPYPPKGLIKEAIKKNLP
ncbi:MAG: DUF2703 domain-containing protein [Candidatus Aenigmatarchaeota archaeon]